MLAIGVGEAEDGPKRVGGGPKAMQSCANKKRRRSVNCDESRSTSQEGSTKKIVQVRISQRRG